MTVNNETEIWKDIPEYEGLYQVSNLSRVRSLDRFVKTNKGGRTLKGRIMKPRLDIYGYFYVGLCKNSIHKSYKVHRLVAQSFIPNPENKPQVNHIDGNKTNNHVDNLEWVTSSENIKHAYSENLKESPKGNNHYNSKLTETKVLEIKKLLEENKLNHREIAKLYSVTRQTISAINLNKNWKHIKIK